PEDGEEIALLVRLPDLQAKVLQGGTAQRSGMLARWFGGNQVALPPADARQGAVDASTDSDAEPVVTASTTASAATTTQLEEVVASVAAVDAGSMPSDTATQQPVDTVVEDGEPPFARISTAVCDVLNNLLQQIEPPPTAADNYQHACEQISKGLNWYELVSTLEEVSLVVLAALERDQGDFQHFLLTLNQRLEQAHQALQASQIHQTERVRDDAALNATVRGEVAQMQVQVAEATQLESLKSEVKQRLSNIVGAMDHHASSEQERQQQFETQLAAVNDRLQEMEKHSQIIEQRLIEQQRLALLDMLTQLPNRHAYDERLEQEFERWQRYRHPLVLAVLDVDHFKTINDNYGHLAGDKVLRIIAKTLRSRLRKTDFIARFGGEEFVVLMPETTLDAALNTLQAMCAAVAECPFHFREQPVSITLSGGVAEFAVGVAADTIFERADAALYRAKAAGRNRCIVAPS
ncbi:MAG TPA: diguanylate cyclase, partial [Spongiibacteraceae bacterium]|nr:diguanylate cyclase [Spongiibacteraceae bacterium]